VGVIIGMISQFILLPFSAFCLIYLLSMDELHATGLLLLACSPGLYKLNSDSDFSLNIALKQIISFGFLKI
jgi:hypothetical protein